MEPMTYTICEPCIDVKDKACVDECPVDCIYEGPRMLYIHPDECVDCGACEPVCPVVAIYYEDDVPEQWAEYYKANVEFFDDLGSPGARRRWGSSPRTTRSSRRCPRKNTTSEPPARRGAPRLPLGHARAVQAGRARASRRDGRPVGRYAGRPHPDAGPRGARGSLGRAGLPADVGLRRPA